MTFSCQAQQDKKSQESSRSITVLLGCDNVEVVSDLKYSTKQLNEFLNKHKIKLIYNKNTNTCGYVLEENTRRKEIGSAFTDVDLLTEIKSFYSIE